MGNRLHHAPLTLAVLGSLVCLVAGCDDGSGAGTDATLSTIQSEIFTPKCALASCHSSTFRGGELVLEEGMSHGQLVGVASFQDAAAAEGLARVVPGDPDASFLWIKVERGIEAKYGELMPQGGSGLPEDDLAAIQTWIENGAADD